MAEPRKGDRAEADDATASEAEADIAERDSQRLRTESSAQAGRTVAPTDLGTHSNIQRATATAGGRSLVVRHGAVGPYTAGMRVPENGFGKDADIQRLIDLGAIGYEDEVPVDELPPRQTLDEASRSDSPPTLPNAPDVDATQADLIAVGHGDLDALERAANAEDTQAMAEDLAAKRAEAAVAAVPERERSSERASRKAQPVASSEKADK